MLLAAAPCILKIRCLCYSNVSSTVKFISRPFHRAACSGFAACAFNQKLKSCDSTDFIKDRKPAKFFCSFTCKRSFVCLLVYFLFPIFCPKAQEANRNLKKKCKGEKGER